MQYSEGLADEIQSETVEQQLLREEVEKTLKLPALPESEKKEPGLAETIPENFAFEPHSFLKKMLHPERLNDDQKMKDIAWYEVDQLCNEVIVNLMNEQNLVSVSVPVTIVGDIHGNFHDLYRALLARTNPDMIEERTSVKVRPFARDRFIFLGDYINVGKRSIECLCLLFALKATSPHRFTLLRGSQEGPIGKHFLTSLEELTPFYANKLQKKFEEVFSWMPLAAVVGEKIFCVHGGISPHLGSLKDIDKIPRPLLDVKENILATDLIFSDPLDYEFLHVPKKEPIFEANYLRHAGVLFNEATVEEFCERTGMKLIVRSHTMIPFGYRLFANRKMITIFTSTGYKKERNHGSVMKVDKDGKITMINFLPAPLKKKKKKDENEQGNDDTNTRTTLDTQTVRTDATTMISERAI
ncbi:hypothetical protein B9Z55_013710 [Caenorhabditis nigoni]|nr:hypothetical protein B9Z55_013710 [Caenorhabditis nigoni]